MTNDIPSTTSSDSFRHLEALIEENRELRARATSMWGMWENLLLRVARHQLDFGPVKYDSVSPDPLWVRVLTQLKAGNLTLGFGGDEVTVSIRCPVDHEGRTVSGLATLTKENLP